MEKYGSIVEDFLRPKSNYTKFARSMAFFAVAVAVLRIEDVPKESTFPWVIGLSLAGTLDLFTFISNIVQTQMEKQIVASNKAREQLEELAISLEKYAIDEESRGAVSNSMARASSFLKQGGIKQPGLMYRLPTKMSTPQQDAIRKAIPGLIRDCEDRIADLRSEKSRRTRFWFWLIDPFRWWRRLVHWVKRSGFFTLRS